MTYSQQHRFYCGVDLHARSMYVHVLDANGKTRFEDDLPAGPDEFLHALKPFRKDLVVGCECMFAWYWLADLCEDEQIPFALGHALAMKHIHQGKAKSDKIDAGKLAAMLRGGLFPLAYVYPRAKRQTRDLLRRRSFFVRQRSQLIAHIQMTNAQGNLPPFPKKLGSAGNRTPAIAERFSEPSTKSAVAADPGDEVASAAGGLRVRAGRNGERVRVLRSAGRVASGDGAGAADEGRLGSGGGGVAADTLPGCGEGDPGVRQPEYAHDRGVLRSVRRRDGAVVGEASGVPAHAEARQLAEHRGMRTECADAPVRSGSAVRNDRGTTGGNGGMVRLGEQQAAWGRLAIPHRRREGEAKVALP
jgi:hypothetical protein